MCSADGAVGWALDSHSRGQGSISGCGSWRRGLELATHAQLLLFTQSMNYECVAGLVSAEGTAQSAVKPWFSFQCTGIHHTVRARTYEGDEHLTYALNKSMAPFSSIENTYLPNNQAFALFLAPMEFLHPSSHAGSDL